MTPESDHNPDRQQLTSLTLSVAKSYSLVFPIDSPRLRVDVASVKIPEEHAETLGGRFLSLFYLTKKAQSSICVIGSPQRHHRSSDKRGDQVSHGQAQKQANPEAVEDPGDFSNFPELPLTT